MKSKLVIFGIFILVIVGCTTPAERLQMKLDATAAADIYHVETTRDANQKKLEATKEAYTLRLESQIRNLELEVALESEKADSYIKTSQSKNNTTMIKALIKTNKKLINQLRFSNFMNGLAALVLTCCLVLLVYSLFKPDVKN